MESGLIDSPGRSVYANRRTCEGIVIPTLVSPRLMGKPELVEVLNTMLPRQGCGSPRQAGQPRKQLLHETETTLAAGLVIAIMKETTPRKNTPSPTVIQRAQ